MPESKTTIKPPVSINVGKKEKEEIYIVGDHQVMLKVDLDKLSIKYLFRILQRMYSDKKISHIDLIGIILFHHQMDINNRNNEYHTILEIIRNVFSEDQVIEFIKYASSLIDNINTDESITTREIHDDHVQEILKLVRSMTNAAGYT